MSKTKSIEFTRNELELLSLVLDNFNQWSLIEYSPFDNPELDKEFPTVKKSMLGKIETAFRDIAPDVNIDQRRAKQQDIEKAKKQHPCLF